MASVRFHCGALRRRTLPCWPAHQSPEQNLAAADLQIGAHTVDHACALVGKYLIMCSLKRYRTSMKWQSEQESGSLALSCGFF